MAMPNNLVFIRHGQSEANVMQGLDKQGRHGEIDSEILERPDWQQRLSAKGIEQARTAGRWLVKAWGGNDRFDVQYVSPYFRTRETAVYLANPELDIADEAAVAAASGTWKTDDRLVERQWGTYGALTRQQQKELFPLTHAHRERDPWNITLDGGESLASGVRNRVRDINGTLHREASGKDVIIVAHGDLINTERQVLEHLLPEEWLAMERDKSQRIRNCSEIAYTRVNPDDPNDIRDRLSWTRFTYTDRPEASPFGGQWRELDVQRRYSTADFIGQLQLAEPLLRNEDAGVPQD